MIIWYNKAESITEDRKAKLKVAFDKADTDKDGLISLKDIGQVVKAHMGDKLTPDREEKIRARVSWTIILVFQRKK